MFAELGKHGQSSQTRRKDTVAAMESWVRKHAGKLSVLSSVDFLWKSRGMDLVDNLIRVTNLIILGGGSFLFFIFLFLVE